MYISALCTLKKGGDTMPKGYAVPYGYMGFVDNSYILFASESDYLEYIQDNH